MTPKTILVFSSKSAENRIWLALEAIVEVKFQFVNSASEFSQADGAIFLSSDHPDFDRVISAKIPSFAFHNGASNASVSRVKFAQSHLLDSRLRSRDLAHQVVAMATLSTLEGDVIIAHDSQPIWVKRFSRPACIDLLALPFPTLGDSEDPLDYFHGGNFIQLLPLLHFLREIVGESGWQAPPLRACLMFDDPNLHWSSYGYIRYGELEKLAGARNFHVALATVPIDSWFVHKQTAALFQANRARFSLLFHGNDHLRGELGRDLDQRAILALLAQSLKRIIGFERRSGLAVCRVMAPPHGACRPQMMRAMLELGFEGACISPWSLRDWGAGHRWPASFGLELSELVSGYFPVPPRFRMSAECSGSIVVSAFLNRPIIPVGHHDTLAGGIDLLGKIADVVNSLGPVQWTSLENILRTNVSTYRDGSTLILKPYSVRFRVRVPEGINSIRIQALANSPSAAFALRRSPGAASSENVSSGSVVKVSPGDHIELTSLSLGTLDHRTIASPFPNPWAPMRRLICEARDRLQPLKRRQARNGVAPFQKPQAAC